MPDPYTPANQTMPMLPGDFILTFTTGLIPRLIRFGQRLKYRHSDYSTWNHACLIVSSTGDLIEAQAHGVRRSHISDYSRYVHVPVISSADDRAHAVAFASHVADLREHYGYLTFISIAFSLLTHIDLQISRAHTHICSGLVADALTRTGVIWDTDPAFISPADLAARYNV